MNLEIYSTVVSVAVLMLAVATVVVACVYIASTQARAYFQTVDYWLYIKTAGVIAILATLGALTYQFVYLTPVCEYCWWQRIFMFPIDIVVLGSVARKVRGNELILGVLSAIGACFAAFHYYFHYQVIILDNAMSMPCSSVGIIPSCTESPVLVFGFITIPLMALVAFMAIMLLAYLAHVSNTESRDNSL